MLLLLAMVILVQLEDVRCQMSDVRCQMPDVRCQMSECDVLNVSVYRSYRSAVLRRTAELD